MPLMDRFREQAAQLAQKTQEAAHEGRAMLDQAQARRRADAMFRDLGAAVYAERTGRGGPGGAKKIERLIKALSRQEAEQGLGENQPPPASENPPPASEQPPPASKNQPPPASKNQPPPASKNQPPPAGT